MIFECVVIEKIEKKDEPTKENILIGPVTLTAKDIEQAKIKVLWQFFQSVFDMKRTIDLDHLEVVARFFRS